MNLEILDFNLTIGGPIEWWTAVLDDGWRL